jgi:hypothetical protein
MNPINKGEKWFDDEKEFPGLDFGLPPADQLRSTVR